jgi:hypothetical protein
VRGALAVRLAGLEVRAGRRALARARALACARAACGVCGGVAALATMCDAALVAQCAWRVAASVTRAASP